MSIFKIGYSHCVDHDKRDTSDYKWHFKNRIQLLRRVTTNESGYTILRQSIVSGKRYEPDTRADTTTNPESPLPGGIPSAEGIPTVMEMG